MKSSSSQLSFVFPVTECSFYDSAEFTVTEEGQQPPSGKKSKVHKRKKELSSSEILKKKRNTLIQQEEEVDPRTKEFMLVYEKELSSYRRRPIKIFRFRFANLHPSYIHYKRAVELADLCNCDFKTYIKTQFYFFDKWFARHPRPHELYGQKKFPTSERIEVYKANHPAEVKNVAIEQPINMEELNRLSNQILQDLMKEYHASDMQIIQMFGAPEVGVFDYRWVKQNPTYRTLVGSNQLVLL